MPDRPARGSISGCPSCPPYPPTVPTSSSGSRTHLGPPRLRRRPPRLRTRGAGRRRRRPREGWTSRATPVAAARSCPWSAAGRPGCPRTSGTGCCRCPRVWAAAADAPAARPGEVPRRAALAGVRPPRLRAARAARRRSRCGSPPPVAAPGRGSGDPWPAATWPAWTATTGELHEDGWLVNQTRMWLASQWAVRAGADWREGAREMYRHLLDGSPAANRLGWQWTVGTGTGKAYGFSRWQVEKRAPALCRDCPLQPRVPGPGLAGRRGRRRGWSRPRGWPADRPTPGRTAAGRTGEPEAVWLTAESLGDTTTRPWPLTRSCPRCSSSTSRCWPGCGCPASGWCSSPRALAELGVEVHLGDPVEELRRTAAGRHRTPVPGWRRRSAAPGRRRPAPVAVAAPARLGLAALLQRVGTMTPTKPCAVCGRTITWRKKWERDWEVGALLLGRLPPGGREAGRHRAGAHRPRPARPARAPARRSARPTPPARSGARTGAA